MGIVAETVILGAGVMGASAAYHLARHGFKGIVVLDQHSQPGQGSTGRATGGFRAQHTSEINVKLSLLSRKKLLCFQDEVGIDSGYRPYGYLLLAQDQSQLEVLREAQGIQKACGLGEAVEVDLADVRRLNPAIALDEVVGGTFCRSDGFLDPLAITRGYIEASKRLGVTFAYSTEYLGLTMRSSGKIQAVRTTRGSIEAVRVINALGAYAGRVGREAGVEIPVSPLRRQVATTVPCDVLSDRMPMTVFVGDGFHLRVRDGRVLLLWPSPRDPVGSFDTSFDRAWLDDVVEKAHRRVPCLRSVQIDEGSCWAGLYEMSPDDHAILGYAPGVENLYLINGSSGHGVMHAPALGQLLAEEIGTGQAQTLETYALRPSRFAEGKANWAVKLL